MLGGFVDACFICSIFFYLALERLQSFIEAEGQYSLRGPSDQSELWQH